MIDPFLLRWFVTLSPSHALSDRRLPIPVPVIFHRPIQTNLFP